MAMHVNGALETAAAQKLLGRLRSLYSTSCRVLDSQTMEVQTLDLTLWSYINYVDEENTSWIKYLDFDDDSQVDDSE